MIDLKKFNNGGHHGGFHLDKEGSFQEFSRLHRLLYETARRYNRTWQELETFKEASGFYSNPLQFLRFPREIRDKIYAYALQSRGVTVVRPRELARVHIEDYASKPSAPNLLLANKQIYSEAIHVLYSKNTFLIFHSQELRDFEQRIGASNCDLIRNIDVRVVDFLPTTNPRGFLDLGGDETYYTGVESPPRWAAALQDSRLKNIVQMTVIGEMISSTEGIVIMPQCLQLAIEAVLSRNQDHLFKPRLILRGFGLAEREKFPSDWEFIFKPLYEIDESNV